jgi:hypothetical protein
VDLQPAEAEVVSREAAAFAQALPDPVARARYESLAASAASGTLPEELVAPLQTMLELVFDTGRPTNRAVLQAVYAKTPLGSQQAASSREINRALEALEGQTIARLRISSGPSQQTLSIETNRVRVQIEFDRRGAHISQLEAG